MGNYEYEPIKKLKENNKKKMFFMFLTIFMFLGISLATIYFVYRFNDERENTITSGLVDIDFKEQGASINLQNTVPMTDEAGKKNDPYVFTVENISKIPINLKIGIEIGTNTIDLSAIRYALYLNNEEVKVDNLENLDSENNLYIKKQFEAGAKIEVKLVFWIDYYYEKGGGSFSGKIKVEGEQYDIIYEETGAETIKKTIGKTGGVIGVTNASEPTSVESNDIREYRYSGTNVNNYIYFNCEADTTAEDASSKCELWRIIGVFKDENGEHLKIVRDNVLTADMFPETYTISGITYKIKYESGGDYAYWNNKTEYNNDWTTAGLQYWLNTVQDETTEAPNQGYLSTLKGNTLSMIEEAKYYLGTVKYNSGIIDIPKEAYANERDIESCIDNTGKDKDESGCRVWEGNKATWKGKIALLYPSDYGFSTKSGNWETQLKNFSTVQSYSWLKSANHNIYEWLLSPSNDAYHAVAHWYPTGNVFDRIVDRDCGVRPTLYLKSDVKIIDGTGTQDSPYTLTME